MHRKSPMCKKLGQGYKSQSLLLAVLDLCWLHYQILVALAAALGSWLELRQLDWRVLRGMSSEDRQKLYILNTERSSSQSAMDDPLESTVAVYSHIINELSIAHDHWISLNSENQTVVIR